MLRLLLLLLLPEDELLLLPEDELLLLPEDELLLLEDELLLLSLDARPRRTILLIYGPSRARAIVDCTWLVRGAVDYYTAGRALPPCPELVASKKEFLLRANPVHQWLARRYEVTGNANDCVPTEEVSREFHDGAKEADERAARWDAVVDYIKARGGGKTKKRVAGRPNPVSVLTGLKPKAAELEAADEEGEGAAAEPDF